ncbi:hypothetical protein IAU59_003175 [Kwoniella sp. CBS 9459]
MSNNDVEISVEISNGPNTQAIAVTLASPLDANVPAPTSLISFESYSLSSRPLSTSRTASDNKGSPLQVGQNLVAGDAVVSLTTDSSSSTVRAQANDQAGAPSVTSLTANDASTSSALAITQPSEQVAPTTSQSLYVSETTSVRLSEDDDKHLPTVVPDSTTQESSTQGPPAATSSLEISSMSSSSAPPPPASLTTSSFVAIAVSEPQEDQMAQTTGDAPMSQSAVPTSSSSQNMATPIPALSSTTRSAAQNFDNLNLASSTTVSTSDTSTVSTASASSTATSKGTLGSGGVMALDLGETSSSTRSSHAASSSSAATGGTSKAATDDLKDIPRISGSSAAKGSSTQSEPAGPSSDIPSGSSSLAAAGSGTATSVASSSTSGGHANQAESNAETKSENQGEKLSSIAIVGIVGGVLLGLILVYLAWYKWRKQRARDALEEIPDDDEKFSPGMHDNRITRSSFGAAEPITPYHHRRRRSEESFGEDGYGDDDEDWYDPDPRVSHEYGGRGQGYEDDLDYDSHRRGTFDDPRTAPMPPGMDVDGRADYGLDHYGDGMTAALADGLSTAAPQTSRSGPAENPFVPPVPPLPSSYSHSKHETIRTLPAVPDDVDPDAGYGVSIYDSYGNQPQTVASRPQTEMMEPSTSNLLPWLNKGNNAAAPPPPMPLLPVPAAIEDDDRDMMHHPDPPRAPPRAMMAQTPVGEAPVGHGGELGVAPIPAFR